LESRDPQLLPLLHKTERKKLMSFLCRSFGIDPCESQDIVSETFLAAAETWPISGVPLHAKAWLYAVASNRSRNHLRRNVLFEDKIVPVLRREEPTADDRDAEFADRFFEDSQLNMLFVICHPAVNVSARMGLALRVFFGFGMEEIAGAFISSSEIVCKRLSRGKETLRKVKIGSGLSSHEIEARLDSVLKILYLLYNEGYSSAFKKTSVHKNLCLEAMRLTYILAEHALTRKPETMALLALMCFHASRFESRTVNGSLVDYEKQDRTLWNAELIAQGYHYLKLAASGSVLTSYHLEAAIASMHASDSPASDKWERILRLYDRLLEIEFSPAASMNRLFALSKTAGKLVALKEAQSLQIPNSHFYRCLMGYLYTGVNTARAEENFQLALKLAKSVEDKMAISQMLTELHPLSTRLHEQIATSDVAGVKAAQNLECAVAR